MQQGNPFAFRKPITLANLDELFEHHRGVTGGWTMTAGPAEPDPPANPPADPPSFEPITSQEELDRRLGARLAREREKYGDYDELKRKAAEFDAAQEAAKTETERAVEAARKEGETTALERVNTRIVNAEARALAAAAKFRNPATAVRLLDLSGVKVNDDGSVDEAAVKAKLDELATAEPYLIDTGDGTAPPRNPKPDDSQGGGGGVDHAGVDRGREMFNSRRKKTS